MSINSGWRYATNTFAVNTRESNVKMLSLSTDTHAKLKAEETNPAIAAILLIYEPVFFAYRDIDQQYGVKSGEYAGNTVGWEQYLDQMPQKLRQWESLIRFVYVEDTPQEIAIFPNKRSPFESGTYESRLDALGALKIKTSADLSLAAAASQITSFYNAALGARLVQQTSEGSLGQIADLRENQRLILANEMTGVLGQLMFIHRYNLVEVERYFDLSLLRDTREESPVELGGGINSLQIINLTELIGEINATPATVIRMKNTSSNAVTLIFYGANNPSDSPGAGPQFTLMPGQTLEKTVAELHLDTLTNFNVQNTSAFAGTWEVKILL